MVSSVLHSINQSPNPANIVGGRCVNVKAIMYVSVC